MEIRELYIKNFGKFSEQRFLIHEGIHVFYGENEYGKSTIYAFIKAMLFGLERGRGKAALNDEFSRFEPWENPNYYAGVMRFSCGGRNFRLERRFDRYTKGSSLICEDDGEELSVEQGDLDMLLEGMSASSFENTAAIGQLTAKPGQNLAAELQNYAANYYETGSGGVDFTGAEEVLKRRKKETEQKLKLLTQKQEEKRQTIRQKCSYIEQEIFRLEQEMLEKQEQRAGMERTVKQLSEEFHRKDGAEDYGIRSSERKASGGIRKFVIGLVFVFLAAILSAAGIFVSTSIPVLLSVSCLIVGAGMIFAGIASQKKQKQSLEKAEKDYLKRQEEKDIREQRVKAQKEKLQRLKWELQRIHEEKREKQVQRDNLMEQLEELEELPEEVRKLKQTWRALELAEQTMAEAAQSISKGFGEMLNARASQILGTITEKKYTRLLVEEPLKLILLEDGRRIPVERVSRGTIEQVYFSLRMAALDILYEDKMPVILDDAFAFYDEKRLKCALKWLSEQQRQVIIFSCQKREAELLQEV